MNIDPLISIITPTLNCENTIEYCLVSVANQTYKNIEHLIIDGLSTDGTIGIIKEYQNMFNHLIFISEKDEGIYDAMNKGIKFAKGEWLYFLGGDDTLYNDNVFLSLLPLLKNTNLKIIYGDVIFKISGKRYDGRFNKLKLLQKNICHQAIFTRKSVYDKLGNFELKYKTLADWHFNMKWFNNASIKHIYTESIIAYYFEDGYCFSNPDKEFYKDFDLNSAKYFPKLIRKIYMCRHNIIVRQIINLS